MKIAFVVADIFLSHASQDRAWASSLAMVLAERGWSVFWDRRIPTGKSFDVVIEQELELKRNLHLLDPDGMKDCTSPRFSRLRPYPV